MHVSVFLFKSATNFALPAKISASVSVARWAVGRVFLFTKRAKRLAPFAVPAFKLPDVFYSVSWSVGVRVCAYFCSEIFTLE